MKTIYDLAVTLARDPAQVADAQALTQDESRPHMGLKGAYGLTEAPRLWYLQARQLSLQIGFTELKCARAVGIRKSSTFS